MIDNKKNIYKNLYLSGLFFVIIFITAIIAFERSNDSYIKFARQETLGNIYQRPLVALLNDIIKHRQLVQSGTLEGKFNKAEIWRVESQISKSFAVLRELQPTVGVALKFTQEELTSTKRENLELGKVSDQWEELKEKTSRINHTDVTKDYHDMISTIRGMITYGGDQSNLILDPDLDSYYVMDVTLLSLPKAIDRLGEIGSMLIPMDEESNDTLTIDRKIEFSSIAKMLQESDMDRIKADFNTAFKEDKNFYGISPTLQKNLEPLLKIYVDSNTVLIDKLKNFTAKKGNIIEVQEAVFRTRTAAVNLCNAAMDELDILFAARIDSYTDKKIKIIAFNFAALIFAIMFFIYIIRRVGSKMEMQHRDIIAAKTAAELANIAKSEFLSNMSHELRTPIHAILSYSSMGKKNLDNIDPEKFSKYFNNIQISGRRQLSLVNALLDLSKLESGKSEFEFEKTDLRTVIDHSQAELSLLAQQKEIKITTITKAKNTSLVFDKNQITQVIVNVLSNAIKFTPVHGAINITLEDSSIQAINGKKPAMLCSIADSGIGIPYEELEKVFDKFIQSSKTKTGAGGTGLGLAICRQIVEAHSGFIWAENRQPLGTIFKILIPTDIPITVFDEETYA